MSIEDVFKNSSHLKGANWDPSELDLESADLLSAKLAQQLVSSTEWQNSFKDTLPTMVRSAEQWLGESEKALKAETEEQTRQTQARLDRARRLARRIAEMEEQHKQPPQIAPAPDLFQVAVRLNKPRTKIGVPEVAVQLRTAVEAPALTEGLTDAKGHAVLSLAAGKLPEKGALILTVTPSGGPRKQVSAIRADVQGKPGTVDSVTADLPSDPGFQPNLDAADRLAEQFEEAFKHTKVAIDNLQLSVANLRDLFAQPRAAIRELLSSAAPTAAVEPELVDEEPATPPSEPAPSEPPKRASTESKRPKRSKGK